MLLSARAFAVSTLIAGLLGSAALAAPPPAATAIPNLPPKDVSPVTVFPKTDAPKIVKSYPAAGQSLSAGVLVLSVTFDQPMIATGFDFGAAADAPKLPCLKTPRLLDDKKTFVLLCTSNAAKTYVLTINATPQGGFQNAAEHRAEPATLSFTTTDANGPIDVHGALKAAGLREMDMPIQEMPERRAEATVP